MLLMMNLLKLLQAILGNPGKLIIAGVGKSGIIGKKIAATLTSTGTPSFFLHPGEAFHGDMGIVGKHDGITAFLFGRNG
jgi:arabinose-5-phosphate isomerase